MNNILFYAALVFNCTVKLYWLNIFLLYMVI